MSTPAHHSYVLQNGRPTIAVLIGSMASEYQEGIMRGAAYVAAEKDYNIIGYSGGAVHSEDPLEVAREKIFELVDMGLIAGVISPFSSLMRFLDKQQRQSFIDRFSTVPVINIGSQVSGHSNVVTDYEAGFIELFDHYYHFHGYRKILLMRGPEHHGSSKTRMNIYQKLLAQYQLPFDPDMVIYSDLNRTSAKLNIEKFLDSSNHSFDAIIAVNDNQAFGIMDACRERGLRIPEDIAVVGSMNTLEGAFATPSLSSIQEPLFELGRAAAIELIAQIEGKPRCADIYIPTSLCVRNSCGCKFSTPNEGLPALTPAEKKYLLSDPNSLYQDIQTNLEKIADQYKGGIMHGEVVSLLAFYQQAIAKKDFTDFLVELKNKLEKVLKSEDIRPWLAVTAQLQLNALRYLQLQTDPQYLISFIAQLVRLKNEIERIAIKFQRYETEYYLNYFRVIVNNLNSSFDLAKIKRYTVDILQLSELYISLFNDGGEDIATATNMVAVRAHQFIDHENSDFVAKNLIPDGVERYSERFTLMIFPLSFRKNTLGFMTANLSSRHGTAFENLRAIISSALKNEILIQDLKQAEKRFSDIAHSTSNWLWETDIANQFTYCSDSALDIIGYSSEMLLGKKINELNIVDGDGYINSMLNHENLTELECWCKHQNGKVICLLISAKPILNGGVFKGYRGIFEDVTEQKLQQEKIKNLAYSDILTGLPNRTLFQDRLAETITFSAINNKKFALMFIDLDHFKVINDSMGHAAGDLLLTKLAQRLSSAIRSRDMLARLGGDEFVIILPDINKEGEIVDIAERIFSSIKEPIILYDKPVYSALSLGISIYPNDGLDAQSLLQKGDNAMYQAKSQGRNGYVFYDKFLEQKYILRNMQEEVLRESLATGGFVLNYQPQVSVETEQIVGFEALVRINNHTHGMVAPNNFIPLAEELGLIGQIDLWVFEKGCAQHAAWRKLGLKHICLSINLSARQLGNDAILTSYLEILCRYDIAPGDIQLEITENALIENERVALKILQGFKRYGVSIALDDFGTGYSALNCINLYPIDTIKIDRSFAKDVANNPKNKAIIQGIVLIARNLNLKIIAEGVETEEQYQLMKQLGCDEIQGFYFYKPCSCDDAQALLENIR